MLLLYLAPLFNEGDFKYKILVTLSMKLVSIMHYMWLWLTLTLPTAIIMQHYRRIKTH